MLESHNLESHVTGGEDENTNSAHTHKHREKQMNIQTLTFLTEQPLTRPQVMEMEV